MVKVSIDRNTVLVMMYTYMCIALYYVTRIRPDRVLMRGSARFYGPDRQRRPPT